MSARVLTAALVTLCLATHPAAADDPASILRADEAVQEAFFDGLVPGLLSAHQVPGAVISVVNDDKVVFAKGWGLANVERGTPMDPATTRMRIASVSKLLTTTAAMQLVERGQLDLHADVNDLLDFAIHSPFGEPITLHHLLTHTAGFDDRFLGTSRPHGEEADPLGQYLRQHLPPVVMPPGKVISYSNHGLALVARLVELASGEEFEAYVAKQVLEPLEMHATTFRVPYPVRDDQARPHLWRDGRFEELWFERLNDWPAGDVSTTALDMANFAIAHLHSGEFRGRRILEARTAEMMQTRQFQHDPRLLGWCYGFSELREHGLDGIGHGGWVIGFHTRFVLRPEERVGFFVSINGEAPGSFHSDLWKAIAERSGVAPPAAVESLAAPEDALAWAGTYVPNRRVRSSWMRALSVAQFLGVTDHGDGTLTLSGPVLPARRLRLVEPDLAVDEESGAALVLRQGPHTGRPQLVMDGGAFDRVDGLASPPLHLFIWGAALAFGLATALGWALGWLARLLRAPPSPLTPVARAIGLGAALLLVATPGGILAHVTGVTSVFELWMEVPPLLRATLWLPLPLTALALLLPFWAVVGLRPGARAPLARLHYGGLTLLTWAFVASAWTLGIRGPWSG